MDRFELSVGQTDLDKQRQAGVAVEELFEFGECVGNFGGRWRDERRLRQRASTRADPVLTSTQVARSKMRASDEMQQLAMNFPDQPHRNG